jgi:zinc protease
MSLRTLRLGLIVLASMLAVSAPRAQVSAPAAPPAAAPAATAALDAVLPLEPSIRTGRLANGLRYFVRQNGRPARRVSLRLAVDVGSVQEEDDQRGLAHFLEHMAFNGSTHFKPGELVAFLESIGARFGPHVNASTSFDETIYMLDVPTDREGYVDKALLVLRDFAAGASLTTEEIDKERGVVLEEWRGRLGASSRITDQQLPEIFYGSRYADRLPIGLPETLKSFPAQRVRDFYRTWYRADRMAVVVSGDVAADEAERLVRERFADLPAPSGPAPPGNTAVPAHAGPRGKSWSSTPRPRAGTSPRRSSTRRRTKTRSAPTADRSCGRSACRCSMPGWPRSPAIPRRRSWRPAPACRRSAGSCRCSS